MTRVPGTVGEAVIRLLEAHGVDTAFGIPGVHTVELYRGLAHSTIRHITPRHEQGAGFMADGYAAATGKPAVCLVITGPGVTNATTAIAQAYHDSRPMVVVSSSTEGGQPGRGRGRLHELDDQRAVTASLTGFSEMVTDPTALPELMQRAFTLFGSARPRPVHISIPIDILASSAPRLEAMTPRIDPPMVSARALAAASDVITRARRPIMILGGGALEAGEEAAALAECIGAPIVLSGNAKGAVSIDHPLCLGCSLPTEAVLDEIRLADVVLAVGTELSEVEELATGRRLAIAGTLIRVDIDAAQLEGADVGLHGDSRAALASLLNEARTVLGKRDGTARALAVKRAIRWWPEVAEHEPWIAAIESAVPDDAVIALDSTQLAYTMHHIYPARIARSWIAPYGYGTLGPALPMAVGAKAATGDRTVLAVAGDGGALFTISELASAVQYSLPIVLMIWNNSAYQEITDSMRRADAEPLGTTLTSIRFEEVARALGGDGVSVQEPDELTRELTAAISSGSRPTVIDIRPADGTPDAAATEEGVSRASGVGITTIRPR